MSGTSLASIGDTGGMTGRSTGSSCPCSGASAPEPPTAAPTPCGTLAGPNRTRRGWMSNAARWTLIVVLVFLALIFFGAGYLYLHEPARHLPKVLGRIPHAQYHRTKRE